MKAPTYKSNAPRQLVPAGTHAARLYSIIDLGTHDVEYQGESKAKRLIRLGWELMDETVNIDGEDKPMVIGKEYTFSLHDKAGLRKAIESMMGKAIPKDRVPTFDVECLLGLPVLLGVVHEQSQTGQTYAKITSYAPPMKSMKLRDASIPTQVFELLPDNHDKFAALPVWIRRKIALAKECPKGWDPEAVKQSTTDSDEIPF